jgi:hypothetical protein
MPKSDYLIERGLANAGLVELTPLLIERYNKALVSMGIEPTKCRVVFIDGAGWSPQVAAEKGNPWYLCDGFTNPTAIIISPDQFKRPVYMPAFSWIRSVLRVVFETYHREIIDITSTDVVTLDFELGITKLESPVDFLLLSEILVKPYSGDLLLRAREQQKLIDEFLENLNCLEAEYREPLIQHRTRYGDLCKRRFFMDEIHSPLARDFWTTAQGGAAVIRNVDGQDLLILEEKDIYETALQSPAPKNAQVLYIYDQRSKPFDMLSKAGMLVLPIESFKSDPNILQEKKEILLALTIGECEPEFDWSAASSVKQNAVVQRNEDKIPAIFMSLNALPHGFAQARVCRACHLIFGFILRLRLNICRRGREKSCGYSLLAKSRGIFSRATPGTRIDSSCGMHRCQIWLRNGSHSIWKSGMCRM